MYIIQIIFSLLLVVNTGSDKCVQKDKYIAPKPIVFIAGFDEGDNQYYTQAKNYFTEQQYTIIEDKYSLKEIVDWLNVQSPSTVSKEIHIVSHSNPWKGLSMKTMPAGQRITIANLASAQHQIPSLKNSIAKDLNIIFHACGLGKNKDLLKAIKTTIDKEDEVALHASPYFNVFGSPFSPHYLAEYYYVFYPTAHSPGRQQLAQELANTYNAELVNWRQALATKGEEIIGMPYRYRFNVPVIWEVEYEMSEHLPILSSEEAIMDWVAGHEDLATQLLELNIPIEK